MNSNIKYLIESFIDDENEIIDVDINFNREGFIDLGLPSGTWWATCNLGASKPEEFGLYYLWGSFEGHEARTFDFNKDDYYKHYHYDVNYYGLSELREEDDAAYVLTNGLARIPTKDQCQELIFKCKYEWTKLNGVEGAKFTGPNGNSIFIPGAGYCFNSSLNSLGFYVYFWSLSLYSDDPRFTYNVCCDISGPYIFDNNRFDGFSVRPVLNKNN